MSLRPANAGFTILEILVALGILAVAMMVMVETQGGALMATLDSDRYLVATTLAQEKLAEAQLRLEREGYSQTDINEEGDFNDFGEAFGGAEVDYSEYKWAYTIRQVDMQLGDISSSLGTLQEAGLGPPSAEGSSSATSSSQFGGNVTSGSPADALSGMPTDMLGEMLSPYLREVRVVVWWGPDSEFEESGGCSSCVQIVTHMINPSGKLNLPSDGSTEP